MGLGTWLLDLLFPPKCAFCRALLEQSGDGVCPACRRALPWSDEKPRKCTFIRGYVAPLYYEEKVRRSVLRYKFENSPALGNTFGGLIAEKLRKEPDMTWDMITWVPLSRRRERDRGYDQARLLAESAAAALNTRAVPLLRKERNAPPQSHLRTPEARRANVSGCYSLLPATGVEGKRILLVDDVITTGATVSECARMLMLAGASEVRAAALACRRKDHAETHHSEGT